MTNEFYAPPSEWAHPTYQANDTDRSALAAMGVDPDEHDLVYLLTAGRPHPDAVRNYLAIRDQVAARTLNGFINAGVATVEEIGHLVASGVDPDALVVATNGPPWRQCEPWRNWQATRTSDATLSLVDDDDLLADFRTQALVAQNIPAHEHALVLALTGAKPTPKLVKRYYALRGTDLNPRARSRKMSRDDLIRLAEAGFDWLGDIELVTKLGLTTDDIVDTSGQLFPQWEQYLASRGRARLADMTYNTGPQRTDLNSNTLLAFIDLETTGIEMRSGGSKETFGNRITEVAVVVCTAGGVVLDEFHTLVDPGPTTTYMATVFDNYARVDALATFTGITSDALVGAPRWADIDARVFSALNGAVVMGHNLSFEADLLSAECHHLGASRPTHPVVDTLTLQRRLGAPSTGLSLTSVAAHYGLDHPHAHTAMGDVRVNMAVGLAQLDQLIGAGVTTLGSIRPIPDGLVCGEVPTKPRDFGLLATN